MSGRSALASASAAASLAAILLAATGCKVQVGSAAQASPAGPLGLINAATSSLRIYSEEMGGTTVENALIRAAKRGVGVQVCGENQGGEYDRAYSKLARAGIRISYYSSPAGFYIHGKVIEADYGTAHGKVFIGPENFSSTSLNDNRELGLIISSQAVMSAINSTFATDFRNGQHWP